MGAIGRLGFLVDADRCIGCHSCVMACRSSRELRPGIPWRRLEALVDTAYPHRDRAFHSLACNHCSRPACLEVCPEAAWEVRAQDGILVHQPVRCLGCGACIRACPYRAVHFDRATKKPEKCDLCCDRLDRGLPAVCVAACPTEALRIVDPEGAEAVGATRFPPGFPNRPDLDPSTRFLSAGAPRVVGRTDFADLDRAMPDDVSLRKAETNGG